MTTKFEHIIPEIEKWPISKLSQNRAKFVSDLNNEVFKIFKEKHEGKFREVLTRTIYLEKIRVKTKPWKVDPGNELQYWRKLGNELQASASQANQTEIETEILKKVINRYSEEIVGNFRPKTFKFARKFLTFFFKRLLNTAANRNYKRLWGTKYQLYDRLKARGELETIRSLMKKGTVVILPTHSSNLDSILIGYAIDSVVGLPAFSYGAGLNLFDAELIAYFMTRLGAYRVDRRKKNAIYLETLKSMSRLSIENGVNSIFFPGGTRSRSGKIDSKLKLGLLNSLVESQRNILQKNINNKIYIVPLVVSYHFILEAKYLIEQHLKREGRERYTVVKDQFKSYTKILKFIWKLFSESSDIYLSFGQPIDIFGNRVDKQGRSFDERGKELFLNDYFRINGKIDLNTQRENIYTKRLAQKIVESYHRENIILSSHLVAYVAFRYLLESNKEKDLYGILNLPADEFNIPKSVFEKEVAMLLKHIVGKEKKGELKISAMLLNPVNEIIEDGVKNLGLYHPMKPLKIKENGDLGSDYLSLLYFYHNRLDNYNFHILMNWRPVIEDVNVI